MFDQPNPMAPKEPAFPASNPPASGGSVEDIFDSFEPVAGPSIPSAPLGNMPAGGGPVPPVPPGGLGSLPDNTGPFASSQAPKASQARPGLIANKKFFIIGLSAVVVVILGVGGYLAYARLFKATPGPTVNLNQNQPVNEEINTNENLNLENNEADLNINAPEEPAEEPVGPVDTDSDGLTDDEEAQLNTDPTSVDTDNDGLFDREEVRVYKTDPSDADSDDDGYLDGAEVKAGYDPKGPGRLFSVETAQ